MVEILLKIFLLIVLIIIFQTTYNGVIWKNKKQIKWLWLALLLIGVVSVGIFGYIGIDQLEKIPVVRVIIGRTNQLVNKIIHYLPYSFILKWFFYPLIVAWIYYLGKAIWKFYTIRNKFNMWAAKNSRTDTKQKENSKKEEKKIRKPAVLKRFMSTEKEEIKPLPITIDDQYLTKIRYKSSLGIQRAYEKAKVKGLQLGKTEDGYIAVYADEAARQKLITILSGFNIDGTNLVPSPAVVTMEESHYESESVVDEEKNLKGGIR